MRNLCYLAAACVLLICSLSYCGHSSRPQDPPIRSNDTIPRRPLPKDIARGKNIFEDHCANCHSLTRTVELDPVVGATERHNIQWLREFTRDNAKLRASGDAYANALYMQYNKALMPAFPQLSDQNIDDLYRYIDNFRIVPN